MSSQGGVHPMFVVECSGGARATRTDEHGQHAPEELTTSRISTSATTSSLTYNTLTLNIPSQGGVHPTFVVECSGRARTTHTDERGQHAP